MTPDRWIDLLGTFAFILGTPGLVGSERISRWGDQVGKFSETVQRNKQTWTASLYRLAFGGRIRLFITGLFSFYLIWPYTVSLTRSTLHSHPGPRSASSVR